MNSLKTFAAAVVVVIALSANWAFGQTSPEQGAGEKTKQVKFYGICEDNTYKFTTSKQNAEVKTYRYDEATEKLVYVHTVFPKPNEVTTLPYFEKGMFVRMITRDNDGFDATDNIHWDTKKSAITNK